MLKSIQNLKNFITSLSSDIRIPARDKMIIAFLMLMIISPLDFIPDWFPVIGQLDDLVMFSLVVDYFFRVLDHKIILSHYPWGMKSFIRIRLLMKPFQFFVPKHLRRKLWKYVPDLY